jgi:hypothetical protein
MNTATMTAMVISHGLTLECHSAPLSSMELVLTGP